MFVIKIFYVISFFLRFCHLLQSKRKFFHYTSLYNSTIIIILSFNMWNLHVRCWCYIALCIESEWEEYDNLLFKNYKKANHVSYAKVFKWSAPQVFVPPKSIINFQIVYCFDRDYWQNAVISFYIVFYCFCCRISLLKLTNNRIFQNKTLS